MREQFNLENFLAGKYERFEIRSGEEVKDLTYFPNANTDGKSLAGVVCDPNFYLRAWDIYGNNNPSDIQSDSDLFGILKQQQ